MAPKKKPRRKFKKSNTRKPKTLTSKKYGEWKIHQTRINKNQKRLNTLQTLIAETTEARDDVMWSISDNNMKDGRQKIKEHKSLDGKLDRYITEKEQKITELEVSRKEADRLTNEIARESAKEILIGLHGIDPEDFHGLHNIDAIHKDTMNDFVVKYNLDESGNELPIKNQLIDRKGKKLRKTDVEWHLNAFYS